MTTVAFDPRPLPARTAAQLRERLVAAHTEHPLSSIDVRATARRVVRIAEALGLSPKVYRGALELGGSEVDHVWLDVGGSVVDAAFPLFDGRFVAALRSWVAGDVTDEHLALVAEDTGVEVRVLGEFPARMRYLGAPVWSSRHY